MAGVADTGFARASEELDLHATRLDPREIAAALVLDARDLIERGWCQNSPALSGTGRAVEPTSAHARRWSALGALVAAYRSSAPHETLARSAFALARRALARRAGDLITWNDEPGRTRTEVLAAFQGAREGLNR